MLYRDCEIKYNEGTSGNARPFPYRLKMKLYRRIKNTLISAALCVAAAVTGLPVTSFAETAWPAGVTVQAEGACAMDADSGTILYGKNQDTPYFPASITKVMTALLVLENCEDLSEMVTFSQEAVELGEDNATIIGASAGDRLSVEDCLYSLLFQSANEVANALAEHVGAKFPELKEEGMTDRQVFVNMMNRRAEEIGCTNTHFNNPSGLTDPNHYTTAHDMCLILAEAIRNERFVDIESHTYWTHAPIRRYPDPDDPWNTVYASHRMLRKNSPNYYPGVFAGKTGYTMTAGNTLVTACRKDGMTIVTTVLNGHQTHYSDTKAMLDFAYDNFHSLRIADYDTTYTAMQQDLQVLGMAVTDMTALAVDEDSRVTLPKEEEFASVTSALSYELPAGAPGDAAAQVLYHYGDRQVGAAYLRSRNLGQDAELLAVAEDPLFQSLTAKAAPEVLSQEESAASGEGAAQAAGETGTEGAPEGQESNGSGEGAMASSETEDSGMVRIFGFRIPVGAAFVLKIIGAAAVVVLLLALWLLHVEKQEAQKRARRRAKRLKHTRDLTGQQNINLDLMVQQRMRQKGRRSRRKPR